MRARIDRRLPRHFKKYVAEVLGDDPRDDPVTYQVHHHLSAVGVARKHGIDWAEPGAEVPIYGYVMKPLTEGGDDLICYLIHRSADSLIENHVPVNAFAKPGEVTNQGTTEMEQINHLADAIDMAKLEHDRDHAKIDLGGKVLNAHGIKQVTRRGLEELGYEAKGIPKADAYLHDRDGRPIHWMSLKGHTFQQWGGPKHVREELSLKRSVSALMSLREELYPESKHLPSGSSYHYQLDPDNDLSDRRMLHMSMYGHDHGYDYGPNNVHAIYQGHKKTNLIHLEKVHPDGIYRFDPNAMYRNDNTQNADYESGAKVLVQPRPSRSGKIDRFDRYMIVSPSFSKNSVPHDVARRDFNKRAEVAGRSFYGPGELE